MTFQVKNSNDLSYLPYLIEQSETGQKNWFGWHQQKLIGIDAAYKIAVNHADKMTPDEIVNFVLELNNRVYDKIIKGENHG